MEEEKVIQETVAEAVEQTEPTKAERYSPDNNLTLMRRKLEAEEQARKQAEARAAEIERRLQSYNQPQQKEVDPDDIVDDPDDIVDNKRLHKTTKKITGKLSETEKRILELQQRLETFEATAAVREIQDFNEVVTEDNVKTFARLYPEDYESMMANPNPKAKLRTAYNMIKNYKISDVSPILKQTEQIKAAEKKIESNKSKPSAAAAVPVSSSPMTKFGRYNEEGRLILEEADVQRINREVRRKLGYG